MIEAFEYTKAFIKAAIADKAHLKKPGYISEEHWVRERNMLGIYYASPTATMEDFARIYGFKNRERPSKIIEASLRHLYLNCPPETQQSFDLDQLYNKKPLTLEQSLRRSRIKAGAISGIISLVNQGKTATEIQQAGYTINDLTRVRRLVARWNIKVPYIEQGYVENILLYEALQRETDPKKIKELFARMNISFYMTHTRGENPLLLTAKDLFSQAGIHYDRKITPTSMLIKSLEETDELIPFGSVTKTVKSGPQRGLKVYYFTLMRFKELAIHALKTHPDLEQFRTNPVVQVLGPPAEKYPTTTEFDPAQSSGNFVSVNNLLSELGVARTGGRSKTMVEFLQGCTDVQIFNYPRKGIYVYHTKQKDALSKFILGRVKVK